MGYEASREVIEWAAEECTRQRSGEMSVLWMLDGWDYALKRAGIPGVGYAIHAPTLEDMLFLGGVVEPRHNNGTSFRKVNVQVGYDVKGPWRLVPEQMENLLSAVGSLPPDEWFREYEEVHPFRDGNGRTGSILWNWLRGTLAFPEAPPDFWSGE